VCSGYRWSEFGVEVVFCGCLLVSCFGWGDGGCVVVLFDVLFVVDVWCCRGFVV